MSVKIISGFNLVDHQKWKEFVIRHPKGNAFHTPEISRIFKDTIRYQLLVFAAVVGDKYEGVLVAVKQKEYKGLLGYLSSRTIVWGGPLVNDTINNNLFISQLLLSELVKNCKYNSVYLEFRNQFDMSLYSELYISKGFQYKEALNFHIKTNKTSDILTGISNSKQRQVKKSLAAGAEIIVPDSISQVLEFYNILKILYSTKVKKPLPHISFFTSFYSNSGRLSCGIYLLIKYKGRIVGGIMCPVFNNKVMYEWYIGGLDKEYREIYPSVLATYAAIDYARNNMYEYFDFMGAGSPNADYGVRDFKSKFGGDLVNYGRFIRIFNKPVYSFVSTVLKLKKIIL
jgi:serine/alanine adding enzyme